MALLTEAIPNLDCAGHSINLPEAQLSRVSGEHFLLTGSFHLSAGWRYTTVVRGLEEFCASLRTALQNPSDVVKQKVLQLVVDRIVVDEQQLTIRHVIPTGPVRLQTRPPSAEHLR